MSVSKEKKQPVLFQEGSRYVLVTPVSPKGFKGSLFVAWEGETPDTLSETIKTTDQLTALRDHRIELTNIPAEWQAAFAKVAGLSIPKPTPESAPAAEPAAEPTAEPAAEPVAPATDPYAQFTARVAAQMAPLCVTWVWAFGIATVIAMLFGIIR